MIAAHASVDFKKIDLRHELDSVREKVAVDLVAEERTIDVHIRRLRKALKCPGGDYSDLIQTVRGTGYRFSTRGVV